MFRHLILSAAIFLGATTFALARPNHDPSTRGQKRAANAQGQRGDRQRHRREAMKSLNLSEGQRQQMRELHQRAKSQNAPLREQMQARRAEYRRLKDANDPRAEQVQSDLEQLRSQMKSSRQAMRSEMENILTAEQRQQLQQMKAARRGYH